MEIPIYNEGLCKEMHKQVEKDFTVVNTRLSTHDGEITELSKASIQLTALVADLTKKANAPKSFWDSPIGGKLFTTIQMIIFAIVGAAIGVNLLK